MKFKEFLKRFASFEAASERESIQMASRYVILSDLHMGDGSSGDDLERNRDLLEASLEYYLERGFTLVLNGDIEDLNKYEFGLIQTAWPRVFELFKAFDSQGLLRKIVGNHDLALLTEKAYPFKLLHSLTLENNGQKLFIFHGHQASHFFMHYNYLSEFIVRYLAKPLRIRNSGIAGDSRQKFKTERRIYRAARELGLVAITGHTHRPLFESLSKYDSLRWSIEELLREYAISDARRRAQIEELVGIYKKELIRLEKKNKAAKKQGKAQALYSEGPFLVPCLFNSGCATGKNGITAIELEGGSINLSHWAKDGANREYIEHEALLKDPIHNGAFCRYILKTEGLDQVFTRIALLG